MKYARHLSLRSQNKQQGFSLVELMVVVAIIGILAALAVPRFQTFQAKARQSEAKVNLAQIYTLATSWYGDNTTYVIPVAVTTAPGACTTDNSLGFKLTDCSKVRYNYTYAGAANTFTAQAANSGAQKVNPACPAVVDTWTINDQKNLQNPVSAITSAGC